MARINVELELSADERFKALARRVGDEDKALGMLIRFWQLAQTYWKKSRQLIPHEVFDLGGFEKILEVHLAERKESGVYARGSEHHFDWLFHKIEAAKEGGKKSAAARKKKYGTSDPHALTSHQEADENPSFTEQEADQKQPRSRPEAAKNPPTPTPSPVPSQIEVISNSVGVSSRAHDPTKYEIPPYEKLKLTAARAVTLVIATFTECGRDGEAARQRLDPIIWEILAEKYPTKTWELWGVNYQRAIDRKGENYFELDLKEHFTASLPAVMKRGRGPP